MYQMVLIKNVLIVGIIIGILSQFILAVTLTSIFTPAPVNTTLTVENVTINANMNLTKFIRIPYYVSSIYNASINLSGYKTYGRNGQTAYNGAGCSNVGNQTDLNYSTYVVSTSGTCIIYENWTLPPNFTPSYPSVYQYALTDGSISCFDYNANDWTVGGGNLVIGCQNGSVIQTAVDLFTTFQYVEGYLEWNGQGSGANYFNGSNENVSLRINSTTVWSYPDIFNKSLNRTTNLATAMDTYLKSCQFMNGYCYIPINFYAASAGIVQYFGLTVEGTDIINNSQSYNSTMTETELQTFLLNVSYNTAAYSSISASLYYNGTAFTSTKTTNSMNVLFNATFDTPTVIANQENKTFKWVVTMTNSSGTFQWNSSIYNQSVYRINFSICDASPQNIVYINFSFRNETANQENVTASFVSSFSYYLGLGSVNKTFSYTSIAEKWSYGLCFSPLNKTLKVSPSITYYNSYSSSRTYVPGVLTVTNLTTSAVLYLLPTSGGGSVSFQIVSSSGQAISGATVSISRTGYGSVEQKLTDDAGIASFFMDSGYSYVVTVSKDGYETVTSTITPSQSSYTIILGGQAISYPISYNRDISYSIYPMEFQLLNSTVYNFNVTLNSSYWTLDSWGFVLTNISGYVFTSVSSSSATGGTIGVDLNTGLNDTILMNLYWYTNSTYTNVTRYWRISNSADTGYSIANFLTRFKTYITDPTDSDGLFGLKFSGGNDFGFSLIIFVIIFAFAGILSYKFGLNSPAAIMMVILGFVYLFDVSLDLLPKGASGYPLVFPLTLVLTIAILFREVGR
jgi:hypothetical protein